MAKIDSVEEVWEFEPKDLTDIEMDSILIPLFLEDQDISRAAATEIRELACSYASWKEAKITARARIISDLEGVAEAFAVMAGIPRLDDARKCLGRISSDALFNLGAELQKHPEWSSGSSFLEWLYSERMNPTVVSEAAAAAVPARRRGDYSDRVVTPMIEQLLCVFAELTGKEPRLNAWMPQSRSAMEFVHRFFKVVDPDLLVGSDRVKSKFDQVVRGRKAKRNLLPNLSSDSSQGG